MSSYTFYRCVYAKLGDNGGKEATSFSCHYSFYSYQYGANAVLLCCDKICKNLLIFFVFPNTTFFVLSIVFYMHILDIALQQWVAYIFLNNMGRFVFYRFDTYTL